ncbi:hypothetical protein Btru_073624 [Bulinus truncatus]|nr:hypothetical protein Btru_073624 [Bulinus truncatus]
MMSGKTLPVPGLLSIQGLGISPQPSYTEDGALSRSSTSEDDDNFSDHGPEFTVLDGVKQMNDILVKQIETLRLKIREDENNFQATKASLIESKEIEVQKRDQDIDDLQESLTCRGHEVRKLQRENEEKERIIARQFAEIEDLKQLVKQTKEYARKINRQVGKIKAEKEKLESDPIYKQQNEEIEKLNAEVELLKDRLSTVELEINRALKVIEQQTEKVNAYEQERIAMHERLQQDLEGSKKSMMQEVERMQEVMSQNCEEIRNINEQNLQMQNDVVAIKAMLIASKSKSFHSPQDLPPPMPPAPMSPVGMIPLPRPTLQKQPSNIQSFSVKNSFTKSKSKETLTNRESDQFSSRDDSPDRSSRTICPQQINLSSNTKSTIPILPPIPLHISDLQFHSSSSSRGNNSKRKIIALKK